MNGIKVLIADASPVYRNVFTQAVAETTPKAAVSSASTVEESLEKIRRSNFDVIIIDAEISKNCLLEFMQDIAHEIPQAALLVTARPAAAKRELVMNAIAKTSAELMIKPLYASYGDNLAAAKEKLAAIVKALTEAREKKEKLTDAAERGNGEKGEKDEKSKKKFRPEIVLVAASTGGPPALENILTSLSESFPAPVLIVQHMLPRFTETLARELNKKSRLTIKVAEDGEQVEAGAIYLAPGGLHMKLSAARTIFLEESAPINGVRPAADALFTSAANARRWAGVLAVILTGMGRDGEKGLIRLKEKQNCFCLAQSEKTCVVYGMPRAAMESGFVDMVVDLDDIAREMENICLTRVSPAEEPERTEASL